MNRSVLSFGSNRFVEARDCMSAGTVVAWPATAITDELWVPFLIIALWVIMEIAFVILLNYILLPNLHKLKPPVPYHGDIVVMMKRTLDQVDILKSYTFEKFVEGFCNAAKFEDVRIDNFRSFMSWLMYHKHLRDLSWEERDKLEYMVQYAAEKHPKALELKDGHNSVITHCRMTLEPLLVIHRPLILYLMANLVEAISNVLFLQSAGFQRLELDGMKYWYKEQGNRQHENQDPNTSDGTEPMVFMHGISTGWMVYLPMVKAMGSGRTMILLDLDAVKIKSLSFDMPTPEQYVDRVNRILKRHSIARASVVGHSFGSITAGWLVRYHPEKVSHLTLVDPVSLLLGLPNVAYSFLYRKPSTLIEWVIHVTAARELTISYSLRRHFWWYNNNLWLEDVPSHIGIVVGVSSNDEIISGAAVFEYTQNCQAARVQQRARFAQQATAEESPRRVTRSQYQREQNKADVQCFNKRKRVAGIECVLWEGFSHGQVLIPGEAQSKFIEMVHTNEKVGSC